MSIELNKWYKLSYSKEEEYSFEVEKIQLLDLIIILACYVIQIETHNNKCRLKATSQLDMDGWMAVLQKALLAAESPYANVRGNSSIKRTKQTISGFLYLVNFISEAVLLDLCTF